MKATIMVLSCIYDDVALSLSPATSKIGLCKTGSLIGNADL